jgi:hypothetical protein
LAAEIVQIQPYPSALDAMHKYKQELSIGRQELFMNLYEWRKVIAIKQNENPYKIMTDHEIHQFCMLLPNCLTTIEDEANPKLGIDKIMKISHIIRQEQGILLKLVKEYIEKHNQSEDVENLDEDDNIPPTKLKSVVTVVLTNEEREVRNVDLPSSKINSEERGVQSVEIPSHLSSIEFQLTHTFRIIV